MQIGIPKWEITQIHNSLFWGEYQKGISHEQFGCLCSLSKMSGQLESVQSKKESYKSR